jgi:5-enolpyruvylshikimate-3-phosphate synthase
VTRPDELRRAEIDTYDDRRMAMTFAVAATRIHGVTIKNAEFVNKTYPAFLRSDENHQIASVIAARLSIAMPPTMPIGIAITAH